MAAPEPAVYGDPVVYRCRCRLAHGVRHVCALCADTSVKQPTEPWVPLERCWTCLTEEEERLLAELDVCRAKLRKARHATDPLTGQRIPPMFLTTQGWTP